tara:strand:+ start:13 stop:471 length:459 start_codon:yes stop_codon:yes gene_type:complete
MPYIGTGGNMNKWKELVAFCAISLFCLGAMTGCTSVSLTAGDSPGSIEHRRGNGPPPWAPAHGYRAKHSYRYYPDSRVYYERSRGVYFYYRNGEWQVSASLPAEIRIGLGDYVTVEMDADRPYVYHSDVEAKYPPGQAKKWKGKGKKKGKKW